MAKIDRNSYQDAKDVFESLIPIASNRVKINDFLGTAIGYADSLNSQNWNLNLDPNGKFIRFNVGREYCIEIKETELLVLCDRLTLKPILKGKNIPVIFRGHRNSQRIESVDIDKVPDCLAQTLNSIGCVLVTSNASKHLDYFKISNKAFIRSAMRTTLLPQMKNAHSSGAIEYLAEQIEYHPQLQTLDELIEHQEKEIEDAKKLSRKDRQKYLQASDPVPKQIEVKQKVFIRNPFVVVEVLDRANGMCERCRKSAPFNRDVNKSPYLEVHHIVTLAEGGHDIIENAIALCPNCHRHAHYGKKTY